MTSQAAPKPGPTGSHTMSAVPRFDGGEMVFLVGAPRSGTTWLQRLLASHPRVRTGQESDLFSKYLGPLVRTWRAQVQAELSEETASGRGGVGLPCYLTEAEYLESLGRHLADLLETVTAGLGPEDLFLEKTPDHAEFIAEIKLLLPRSRFIHLIRDPRDVVASMLDASRGWGKAWAPPKAELAAARWRTLVSAARAAGEGLPASEYREVRYEQLIADPAGVLRGLAAFLDLSWDQATIEAAVHANRPAAAERGGGTEIEVRGEFGRAANPVVRDPPGFIRSGVEGGWQRELSLKAKIQVWRQLRRHLDAYGYPWPLRTWIPLAGRTRRPSAD